MNEILNEFDVKMNKSIDVVKSNFSSVRAGRANAAVLDRITVEYYGTPRPADHCEAHIAHAFPVHAHSLIDF